MLTAKQIEFVRQTALALFEAPDEGADLGTTYRKHPCGALACACGWWALRFGYEYGFRKGDDGYRLFRDGQPADYEDVYSGVFGMTSQVGHDLFGFVTRSKYDKDLLDPVEFDRIEYTSHPPDAGWMHKRLFIGRVLAFCKEHNIDHTLILTPEMLK